MMKMIDPDLYDYLWPTIHEDIYPETFIEELNKRGFTIIKTETRTDEPTYNSDDVMSDLAETVSSAVSDLTYTVSEVVSELRESASDFLRIASQAVRQRKGDDE